MTSSAAATAPPSSSTMARQDPVWRIITGFVVFAFGVILCGALTTHDPQHSSWNAATDVEVTNLFGPAGATIADVLLQLFGWGGAVMAFLLFSAGLKRMLLIGEPSSTRWFLGGLSCVLFAGCLASWPIPRDWVYSVSVGGLVGDGLFTMAALPFQALQLPYPKIIAGACLGLAGLACLATASNLAGDDLVDLFKSGGAAAWRLVQIVLKPFGPVGRWLGALLVGAVVFFRDRLLGLFNRKPENPYVSAGSSYSGPDEDDLRYYEYSPDDEPDGSGPAAPGGAQAQRTPDPEPEETVTPPPRGKAKTKAKPKTAPRTEEPRKQKRRPHVDAAGLPSLDLLVDPPHRTANVDEAALLQRAEHLMRILNEFGVKGRITHVRPGPVVTLFELEPAPGVKSSRVIALADDVARSMSATSARVAVIPGKNAIGIELPNTDRDTVYLRKLLESPSFTSSKQALPLALGEDIGGEPVCADLAKMPHLLIAGTTGSGKSVGINAMILSLMFKLPPEKCRFIMVDPKMLELSIYEGVPHLLAPVVIDPKKAVTALKWAVREMESRYEMMSKAGVRNLAGFNEKVETLRREGGRLTREVQTGYEADTGRPIYETEEIPLDPIPNIVVVIDEMADLMMVAGKEIEACIQRLAQMARAAGIHLITATQRPSVDVITGTIKANFPTRISYMVSSKIDSRTILGEQGAEQLLGMGDLLWMASGGKIKRLHGPFVSDEEVGDIVEYLKSTGAPDYSVDITEEPEEPADSPVMDAMLGGNDEQDLYAQAVAVVVRDGRASTSYVQRRLKIGYNRAASLIEQMEEEGIISAPNHAGKREVLKKKPDDE